MSPIVFALGASIAIIIVSLIGVITLNNIIKARAERWLPFLLSGSAGLFLVMVATLFIEALEMLPLSMTLALVSLGFLLLLILSWLLPESHHHHTSEECEESGPKRPHARRILIADSIHNIGDGIVLVPAFMISPALGVGVAISILAHEAVQELSEFFVLRAAGLSVKRALLYNFATALTILIGVGVGAVVAQFETITAGLLAISAGAFLYVVFKDLIPHSLAHSAAHSGMLPHLIAAMIGVVVMVGITLAAPHEHAHQDGHDHFHEADKQHHEAHNNAPSQRKEHGTPNDRYRRSATTEFVPTP